MGIDNELRQTHEGVTHETAAPLDRLQMEEPAIELLMVANAESMAMACEITRITGERLPGVDVC